MREVTFSVTFEPGASPLMDLYRQYPSLTTWSSACFTTDEAMWRIDHTKGPGEALEAFDDVYLDEDRCNECLSAPNCDTYREYHTLNRTATSRTVYTRRYEVYRCHSIPYIVFDRVGDGVVFKARRTDGEYRWRVLYPGEYSLGQLYDDVQAELREGLDLELLRLEQSGNWTAETLAAANLSHEHQEALETAYEAGYYERPRETSVEELAADLGVPRSTLQYRLRTAEDYVVSQFVENTI